MEAIPVRYLNVLGAMRDQAIFTGIHSFALPAFLGVEMILGNHLDVWP